MLSLPSVITVPFYDPSRKSGAARLLSIGEKSVKVKFIISGGRAQEIPLARLSTEDREAVALWYRYTSHDEGAAEGAAEVAAEVAAEGAAEGAAGCGAEKAPPPPWEPFKRGTSTWHRLLCYGSVCRSGHALSSVGMRALWGVILPDKANNWLDNMNALPLKTLLSHFITVWWHYCCACAHTDVKTLTPRQRVFVLELMCSSMQQRGSKHSCVFSALLMQIVLLFCHDQSVCGIGADLNDVGYNHKIDCGKIGPVVEFSALLRHAETAECASSTVSKVRQPKRRIVWLLQRPSMKFRRLRKYKLYDKFVSAEGGNTRLEASTNRIKYWNEEAEDHIYASDFHTTLDSVAFKRCGDELQEGDVWLENATEEWLVESVEPQGSSARPPVVVKCTRRGKTRLVQCAFNLTIPVGTTKECRDAVLFLRDNPDVVDTMCLSTGPPPGNMGKLRPRPKLCDISCQEVPIKCSWEEYLLWRCAVSASALSMDERCARVAAPFIKRAGLAWLV